MAPKVSVIIPVYNVELYIRECLDSVVNQTLRELEVIIVNDGSTDRSAEIAREYEKLDIRVKVYDRPNQGPAFARNTGVALAKGEYVAFLDSDDWLPLEAYEILYNKVIATESDIVRCSLTPIHPDGTSVQDVYYNTEKLAAFKRPVSFQDFKEEIFKLSVSPTSGLFKRMFLINEAIQFPIGLINEDEYFTTLALLRARKIVAVSSSLYFYRARQGSIMNLRRSGVRQLDLFKVLILLMKEIKRSAASEEVIRCYLNMKCIPEMLFHFRWRIHQKQKLAAWWQIRRLKKHINEAHLTPRNRDEWRFFTSCYGLIFRDQDHLGNLPKWLFQIKRSNNELGIRIFGVWLIGNVSDSAGTDETR